jgi:8-oxo-dGTP pyrophosphatase MutT (NUDIX family)
VSAPPLHADAVAVLSGWAAPDAAQEALRTDYLAHLAAHADGVWREGPPEHLTASCFVLDADLERVLLTLHGKARRWMQVGGHLEPGDRTLADAALREATEESGIAGLRLLPTGSPAPVDLDRHALPGAFGRCREHLDVAWVALAPSGAEPTLSHESLDLAWFALTALPADVVPDLPPRLLRAAAAARARAQSPSARSASSADSPTPSPSVSPTVSASPTVSPSPTLSSPGVGSPAAADTPSR